MPQLRFFPRMAQASVAFPLLAAILLALIWLGTRGLMDLEIDSARRSAGILSRELLGTYNAQVVRALGEIDQTLKLVKYAYERDRDTDPLPELQERSLLPPELIFSVSIADRTGKVIASNGAAAPASVAGEDYFEEQRESESDSMSIGRTAPSRSSRVMISPPAVRPSRRWRGWLAAMK